MNPFYRILLIKKVPLYFIVTTYLTVSTATVFVFLNRDLQVSEQLVLKNLSNDTTFKDYRFAEQKYLGMCKIINVDRLVINFKVGKLDIDCAEKGIFVLKSMREFNNSIYEIFYRIDNYLIYILINCTLCLLLFLLFLSFRKIEFQRNKLAEIQKKQLLKEKQIYQQVAHDIRSPLSVINMLVPTISISSDEKSELIMQAVSRINGIAEDLLQKGKSNAKNLGYNIVGVIEKVVAEKQITFKNVDLKFNHSLGYDQFKTKINETVLSRVMSNLLNNSLEALPDGKGKVLVDLTFNGNWVEITISDNGKGIPKSVLEKVGTEGFTFGKENSYTAGSGLGVYYCKSAIEQAGGTLVIHSTEDKGTSVEINFPLEVD